MEATPEFLGEQLDNIFTDIYPDAVKIGMVSSSGLITKIADKLKEYDAKNIVVDPVMVATSGARLISEEAIDALKAQCVMDPDVQVVVSDGLSTDAITANYEEILPPLLAGLKQAGLKVGTPFFVRYGRVKIEDQIGEILGAKVVILLVGERPGLGQSESLSCYAVYSPRVATTVEADRTCISNIHQGGTPPVEAAAVIVDLAKRMLEQKASGSNMSR